MEQYFNRANNYKSEYMSPLGKIYLEADEENLLGLWFEKQPNIRILKHHKQDDSLEIFKLTKKWLDDYFAGKSPSPDLIPMKLEGTPFQLSIWNAIRQIPYGKLTTYPKICDIIGKHCTLTTGVAIGDNPISIIIPDHRVITKSGHFSDYAGGVKRQIALLKIEGIDTWCHPPRVFFFENYLL